LCFDASLGTLTLLLNIGELLGLYLELSSLSLVDIFFIFVIKALWWKAKLHVYSQCFHNLLLALASSGAIDKAKTFRQSIKSF
jgi:hypothetical protein